MKITLYIYRHNLTKLLYFGRTTKMHKKYFGSGPNWKRHLVKHGKSVTLEYSEIFDNQEDATEFAIFFSEEFDIVKSDKWANARIEDAKHYSGGPRSEKSKLNMRNAQLKNNFMRGRFGELHHNYGKLRSEDAKLKSSIALSGRICPKVTCPHCGVTGGNATMPRWHFDNCKRKE